MHPACCKGRSSAASKHLSRVKLRPLGVLVFATRLDKLFGWEIQHRQPGQPSAASDSAEEMDQYRRTMQDLLQRQRQAARERHSVASGTGIAVSAPAVEAVGQPSTSHAHVSASQPVRMGSARPACSSQALGTSQSVLPDSQVSSQPPLLQSQPAEGKNPESLCLTAGDVDQYSSLLARQSFQGALPSAAPQFKPDAVATLGKSADIPRMTSQQQPQPLLTSQQQQLVDQPSQQQQEFQQRLLPNSTPLPSTQRKTERSARRALPDLLPGVRTSKTKDNATDVAGVGPNRLPCSTRPELPGRSGSLGVIVGSTRSAKSTFGPPELPRGNMRPGPATTSSYGGPFGYSSTTPELCRAGSNFGEGITAAAVPWSQQPPPAARGVEQPPMVQRTTLSLNPNMHYGPPTSSGQHKPSNNAGVPGLPRVNPAAASSSKGSGGPAAVGPAPSTSSPRSPVEGDGATLAFAAGSSAVKAQGVKPRKPARPAALWLSSFVHATGKAGGTSEAGNGIVSAAATAATASAKPHVEDAGVVAAEMVRVAADRPALEMAESVSDLPVSIPQLQTRLEAAVQAEQESELRALRALYASGSLRQLQREGVVLVGLAAAEVGRLYRSTLWRFSLMEKKGSSNATTSALPYHKLRPGASVIITAHVTFDDKRAAADAGVDAETGLPAGGVEGVVVEAHKDHLLVALESRSHETFQTMVSESRNTSTSGRIGSGCGVISTGQTGAAGELMGWRLDQSVRDTTTRRHLEGIRRLGCWTETSAEERLGEARVRAVLAGSRSAAVLAAEPPEWVKEDRWREDARTALAAQQGLNDSQRRAVAAALTRTVTLWQGPPGTGKTRTLLALIEILVRVRNVGTVTRKARGSGAAIRSTSPREVAMGPVLAVADTNAAVDNLVEGLAARGVKAVRLGPAAKARESLRHLSLEAQAEASPLGHKAVALRTQALRKQEQWREPGGPKSDAGIASMAAAQAAEVRADLERAEAALREAAASIVASAEVVVATCTAAGDSMLDGRPWRCVVVDEASQATEPSVLVALTRGAAFVVMAGDPRQLPPTVLSEAALQHGLDVTLFERVAGPGGVTPLLLDTQYRMHPAISAFPSAFFYGGRLRDGVAAADKPVPRGFSWPSPSKPLALVQVKGGKEETSGGIAELAAAMSGGAGGESLRPKGVAGGKPGAAEATAAAPAPQRSSDKASYRNMAEALVALAVTRQLLAGGDVTSAAILTPYRGQVRLIEALTRQRGLEAAWSAAGQEVAVSTVDGYQGREADVVVFSAVRANDRGAVGFLSDPRRMNVAITRPRRGLVVLADTETLTRGSSDWGMYVKWARAQGVLVPAEDVLDVEAALSGAVAALSEDSESDSGEGGGAVRTSTARPRTSARSNAADTTSRRAVAESDRSGRSSNSSGSGTAGGITGRALVTKKILMSRVTTGANVSVDAKKEEENFMKLKGSKRGKAARAATAAAAALEDEQIEKGGTILEGRSEELQQQKQEQEHAAELQPKQRRQRLTKLE